MALTYTFSTTATLVGAARMNRMHRNAAQEDLGYKLERLISSVNLLNSNVSAIMVAMGSAAASLAGASLFSAFSAFAGGTAGGLASTLAALSNFRASAQG